MIDHELIEKIIKQFDEVASKFTAGVCNSRVVQSITFTVPDIFSFVDNINQLLVEHHNIKDAPNKNFDCEDPPIDSAWYLNIADLKQIEQMTLEEQLVLWEKLSIQLTHRNAGLPFRVWDNVRYNENTYNYLKQKGMENE